MPAQWVRGIVRARTGLGRMSTVSPRPVPPSNSVRCFLPHFINCLHCVFLQINMDRDVSEVDRRFDLCTILGRESYGTVAQATDKASGK